MSAGTLWHPIVVAADAEEAAVRATAIYKLAKVVSVDHLHTARSHNDHPADGLI